MIYRGLFDDLGMVGGTGAGGSGGVVGAVIPVVGVGVALSDTIGYDAELLAGAAREAATRAAIDVDARCSSETAE